MNAPSLKAPSGWSGSDTGGVDPRAPSARFDFASYVARSRALDLEGIDWEAVPRTPLDARALRTLRHMQEIEAHTIVFPRTIFSARAVDDPQVATFLVCWLYEEMFHGRALARFLAAAGHPVATPPRRRESLRDRYESLATAVLSGVWPDFLALHMTWGAIHELTTLTAYRRFSEVAGHPVLSDLLSRIVRDEARHFSFYFHQAERRLQRPAAARVTRFLVDRLWAPVGDGVRPKPEMRFVARYLFTGEAGKTATRRVDQTIRRLPGFSDADLLEAWVEREACE